MVLVVAGIVNGAFAALEMVGLGLAAQEKPFS